jgi:hypothetical protein
MPNKYKCPCCSKNFSETTIKVHRKIVIDSVFHQEAIPQQQRERMIKEIKDKYTYILKNPWSETVMEEEEEYESVLDYNDPLYEGFNIPRGLLEKLVRWG